MHRFTEFLTQTPRQVDLLQGQQWAMEGLGLALLDVLGSSTALAGLACAPTSPASMEVQVGPGRVYSLEDLEATVWGQLSVPPPGQTGVGGLPADTNANHQIMKQGIVRDPTLFTLTAPTTPGDSINYLIEVEYQDEDNDASQIYFYNAANPLSPIASTLTTARQGVCALQLKAGTAAATGTQVTPTPDAGWTGAWVIAVPYGATTVTSGDITAYAGAPFIPLTLVEAAPLASPAFTGTPTAPTPAANDSSTKLATTAFVAGTVRSGPVQKFLGTGSFDYVPSPGMLWCDVELQAPGAPGGGTTATNGAAGGGGGPGERVKKRYTAAQIAAALVDGSIPITIPAPPAPTTNTGGNSSNTTFGSLLTADGGHGGSQGTSATGAAAPGVGGYAGLGDESATDHGDPGLGSEGGGKGGAAAMGGPGPANFTTGGGPGNSAVPYGYGGGGGGAFTGSSATAQTGGIAGQGACIVTEYCNQ